MSSAAAAASVQPNDGLDALAWLATTLDVPFDSTRAEGVLSARALNLRDEDAARQLGLAAVAGHLSVRWIDSRVQDLGRGMPVVVFAPVPGTRESAAVCVRRGRFGRHRVEMIHQGRREQRWLSTSALAALLQVPVAGVVRALAPVPALPLQPVVDLAHTRTPWQRARALLAIDRDDIWVCAVYGIVIGILSLATPIAVQALVNTVSFGTLLQPLVVLVVLVALVLGLAGAVRLLQAQVVEQFQSRMFVRAACDLARRFVHAEPASLERARTPELMYRCFELPVIQKASAILLVDGIDLVLRLAIGMPLLAFYHPILLAFAIGLVIAIAIVLALGGRGAVRTAIAESNAKYAAVSWLDQIASGRGAFSSTQAREGVVDQTYRVARRYRDARGHHFTRLHRHLLGGIFVQLAGNAILLGVGGWLVMRGQLSLGQLVASELVFASIGLALVKLHKQLEAGYDIMASSYKLGALVDIPLERVGGERLDEARVAAVTVEGVQVDFERRPAALPATTLELAARDRVRVTGPAGSGKSLLLEVLAHLRDPTAGTVTVGGVRRELLDLAELREHTRLVREAPLVAGTVLDNVRLFAPDTPIERAHELLALLELDAELAHHADGATTELAPSGAPLSSTMRRRLLLARALVAAPRVLLLDGALDDLGLSAAAKAALLDAVLGPSAPWAAVVVTADPEIAARCSSELVLAATERAA